MEEKLNKVVEKKESDLEKYAKVGAYRLASGGFSATTIFLAQYYFPNFLKDASPAVIGAHIYVIDTLYNFAIMVFRKFWKRFSTNNNSAIVD